ncbi:hypothetical protein [Nocardiopsis halotolerans]|uniref:hypothetical protein n=1 Tax=Nocardiopsis halotolerans TaxID=124252 RepID=UPI000349B2AF|nr:hypothetical protein [Nocardiopsis halotolerans]
MYPQQPSNDPNQDGPHPEGRYPPGQQPQDPQPYGNHPQPPGVPVSGRGVGMPGAAITVRVLMFIGGVCGVLLGVLMWLAAVAVTAEGELGESFMRGVREASGMPLSGGEAGMLFAVVGAVPFVYGVVSLLLASLMGRRSPAVLWSVVVFQGLVALFLLFNVFTGALGALIPLAFAILMIVLMLLGSTRDYYTRPAPAAH